RVLAGAKRSSAQAQPAWAISGLLSAAACPADPARQREPGEPPFVRQTADGPQTCPEGAIEVARRASDSHQTSDAKMMGWLTGLEPATRGDTGRCSTIDLQPPRRPHYRR